jgi:hypothetical protein
MMKNPTVSVTTTRTGLTDGSLIVHWANWPPARTRKRSMKFTIQVLIESPDALPLSVPIQALDRTCEHVEDVGLRLDEAKAILHGLQEQLIRQQLVGYLDAHRPCPCCHRLRAIKGYHPLRFRSAFGDLELRSPRWCRCACEERSPQAT